MDAKAEKLFFGGIGNTLYKMFSSCLKYKLVDMQEKRLEEPY